MQSHCSKVEYGQRVTVDGDDSLHAVVTAFLFRKGYPVEVSYVCNSEIKSAWVEEWRVDPV